MEIHQLQYVVEVAKQRNFTRAADEICVSQSTLSHQIAKLEDELGIKLFERKARTVELTEAGEEFIAHAKEVLNHLETARQSVQDYIGLLKGTLRIGVIASTGRINYVGMLATFHKQHPGLHYQIIQSGSYDLLDKLSAGELDVAIVILPAANEYEDIEFHHLAYDHYVLAVPPNHPFAGREQVDLAEAANEQFIFHQTSERMYYICMEACARAGFKPSIVCQSSHSPTCMSLISAGLGIGFFPTEKIEGQSFEMAIVKIKQPIVKDVALAIRKHALNPPAVVKFTRFVLQWVKNLQME